ncbi:MAG: GntR family transcriptional regulator [Gammaproteobacteria bacterium]|jgi:DNA-binding transcriptional regulator YhcF (GntR family)
MITRLPVDPADDTPVARQIAEGLRVLLARGTLTPGEDLPSSRALASHLGVHFNTVAQAYRELAKEGWLDLTRKRGTRVLKRRMPRPAPGLREALRFRAERLAARYWAAGLSIADIRQALAQGVDGDDD